jgi:acid phosphatase class B
MEESNNMKKLFASVATLALACTLASPAFAKKSKKDAKSDTTTTQSTKKSKLHWLHGKKKGATKGDKKGQQGTNPSN